MLADRQTHTHTDTVIITILCRLTGGEVITTILLTCWCLHSGCRYVGTGGVSYVRGWKTITNKQTNRITTVRFLAGSCVNFHGNKPLHQRGITASFTCITEGFQRLPRYYRRPITVQGWTLHLNRLIGEICGPNGNRRYYCDNSSYYPRSGLQ